MGNEKEEVPFEAVEDEKVEPSITIKDVFKTDGILSEKLDGYEPRESQVRLAVAIDNALEHGRNIAGEGPCGVGKTISYLVPSILKVHKGRTVVATANIGLQEQLIKKDLPFLQEILPVKFKYALMKGRNNYLCKDALESSSNAQFGMDIDNESIQMIVDWSKKTLTGDRSELLVEPVDGVWNKFSVTSEDCVGHVCPFKDECYANMARQALNDADIVVCNYHLLFAHVKTKLETTKDLVLPPFKYLILDEAHKTADIARSFFGWNASEFAVNLLLRKFKDAYKKADKAGAIEPDALTTCKKTDQEVHESILQTWDSGRYFHAESIGAKRIQKKGAITCAGISSALEDMGAWFRKLSNMEITDEPGKEKLKQASKRSRDLSDQFDELGSLSGDESVYFTERSGKRKTVRFCKRQINVAEDLWEFFSGVESVVATSATLAVDGSCKYVRDEMGLKKADEIILDSPFDYKKQALLVVSPNAPNPQQDGHIEKVCKVLEFVIKEADGRTLALFTSNKAMRAARDHLANHNPNGYTIMCQGDAPRSKLVEDFKNETASVLLGTESFWAGVDVPGESLSCLVIDKLPFKSPSDPVWSALCDQAGDSWFFKRAIPQAVIQMKQGIGRLIRNGTDRGIIIILDCRLSTKGYGSTFVESFPPMRKARTLKGTIKSFLNEGYHYDV